MGKYFTSEETKQYESIILESLDNTPTDTIIPNFNDVVENTENINLIQKTPSKSPIIEEVTQNNITPPKEIKQTEILEKLSQHSFLMIQINDRLMKIENMLLSLTGAEITPKETGVGRELTPRELYEESLKADEKIDYMDVNVVRKKIDTMKDNIPNIPLEDYIDNGVKLEELFPNMPDEAYQAAYKSMDSKNNKPGSGIVF